MAETTALIENFLKTHDRDRYLASLVLPQTYRAAIQSLYAFNADIAAIPSRVSEPAPGEIRLQWWHDALEGAGHGEVSQNPLAAALIDTIKQFQLPTGPLLRMIAARRFDLYQDPMPNLQTFEGYAGETCSVLYQYAAMILADGAEPESGDAAGHLGVAHTLIGHMRAFGFNAARGRIYLPLSVFTAHGVTDQQILTGTPSPGIAHAISQLHETAADHLQKTELAIRQSPKSQRAAFAHLCLLRRQLKYLNRMDNPFAVPYNYPDWRKIIALIWWSASSG